MRRKEEVPGQVGEGGGRAGSWAEPKELELQLRSTLSEGGEGDRRSAGLEPGQRVGSGHLGTH